MARRTKRKGSTRGKAAKRTRKPAPKAVRKAMRRNAPSVRIAVAQRPALTAAFAAPRPVVTAAQRQGSFTAASDAAVVAVPARPFSLPHARALRRDDFLALDFTFVNLRVAKTPAPARLVRITAGQPAFIVIGFPPQNIGERAFFDNSNDDPAEAIKPKSNDPDKSKGSETPTAPPVGSRISNDSRLVFRVDPGVNSIPYTLAAILARCTTDRLSVAPTALAPPPEPPRRGLVFQASDVLIAGARVARIVKGRAKAARAKAPAATPADARRLVAGFRAQMLEARGLAIIQTSDAVALDVAALPKMRPKLVEPTLTQTAIEMPLRVVLSPHVDTGFAHASAPVTSPAGRTELWHTRLGLRRSGKKLLENERLPQAVRAIWARSGPRPLAGGKEGFYPEQHAHPGHANTDDPFRMSLDAYDRHNFVHLSSNWFLPGDFKPLGLDVDRLMLTSLGGYLDSRGAWVPPQGLSVEEWRHRAALARDHYVRVVYAGFLMPFGHRASLVKVTERKFHPDTPGNVAYLRQRMFIVVGEPVKDLRNSGFVANDLTDPAATGLQLDHQMPFARVRITTKVTPNLDKPEDTSLRADLTQSAFWPSINGAAFQFHVEAEDVAGNRCDFTLPMPWIEKTVIDGKFATAPLGITVTDLMKIYDAGATESLRKVQIGGKKLAYAIPGKRGDTSFETQTLTFGVQLPKASDYNALPSNRARFLPVLRKAGLVLSVAKHFVGKGEATEFRYPTVFLQNPLTPTGAPAANKGEVILEILKGKEIGLDFSKGGGDKAGGLTKPNITISGLSRRLGPIAGPGATAKIAAGQFDPPDFFKVIAGAVPAKLFGVIDLWDVVEALGLDDDINAIPKLLGSDGTALEHFIDDIVALKTALDKLLAAGGQIAAKVTAIVGPNGDVDRVFDAISNLDVAGLPGQVQSLGTDITDLLNLIPGASGVSDAVRQETKRLLEQLQPILAKVNEIVGWVQKIIDAAEAAAEGRFRFEWKPRLANWPKTDPIFVAKKPANGFNEDAYFVIAAEIRTGTGGGEPSVDVLCGLEKFKLDLIAPASFFGLHFDHIRFIAKPGKKPEVDVLLESVEFEGPLSFLNSLKDLIPLDGFSDPPALTVDERGIDASFSLPLPNIAIGVFALTNLSLGAGFTVPFIGEPLSARFFFCKRDAPFTLQVGFLGGGGFFGITVDPGGVQLLEVALEFGATLSLDFGVASGNIHVMAGIYFRMEKNEAQLTGYFRAGGSVNVLGLITASIELVLQLSYQFSSGKAIGEATLTIEISIFCFSASVELHAERKFAGSNGDPTFVELMGPDPALAADSPWRDYCAAFA